MTRQTQKTIILCSISAVLCGVLLTYYGSCPNHLNTYSSALESCRLMALRTPLKLDFNWVNWAPGLLFGFFFAIANLTRKFYIVVFMLVSGIVYYLAGLIFALFVAMIDYDWPLLGTALLLMIGAIVSGFFGAFTLALIGKYFSKNSFTLKEEMRTALVGALTGALLFGSLLLGIFTYAIVFWSLGFPIWQVWVGMSLTSRLQKPSLA